MLIFRSHSPVSITLKCIFVLLMLAIAGCNEPQPVVTSTDGLPRTSPESQGISSEAISQFIEAANASGLEWHSFMLKRHGQVVAEGWWDPYQPEYKHTLYSLSKSFTSTAVGLCVDDGLLSVDDKVVSFFPDLVPEEHDERLDRMTIQHLLTMNTGHGTDSWMSILNAQEEGWIPAFLSHPFEDEPGTAFFYDTGATFMLSAIVQNVTGKTVEDLLTERVFTPLSIEEHDWELSPEGINAGGIGLRVTTEAIAKFGQLYLQKGEWKGNQLLSKEWVEAATSIQTKSFEGDGDWAQGYGYQFWRSRYGTYRGDGAYGQYCLIFPEHDAVMAITSESMDMGASMEVVWEHILPAFEEEPLEENLSALEDLEQTISALRLPTLPVNRIEASEALFMGHDIVMNENPYGVTSFHLTMEADILTCSMKTGEEENLLNAGSGTWVTNSPETKNLFPAFYRTDKPSLLAANFHWQDEQTLVIQLKQVEGMHGDKLWITFDGEDVTVAFLNSIAEQEPNERNKELRVPMTGKLL